MPDLDFLSAAYQNGEVLGRAFRWMMLLAIALSVVVGVARGTFGRSRLRVAGTVVGVVVCLVGALHDDYFGGHARADPAVTVRRARGGQLGCLDQGQPRSVCECYGDEVLRRIAMTRASASPRSSARWSAGRTPARRRPSCSRRPHRPAPAATASRRSA